MTVTAKWNGEIIAQSDDTVVIEGNHYFKRTDVKDSFLKDSDTHSVCPWKGTASYHTIEVGGEQNTDAAWYYPEAKSAAKDIEGRIAFWKGVEITEGA